MFALYRTASLYGSVVLPQRKIPGVDIRPVSLRGLVVHCDVGVGRRGARNLFQPEHTRGVYEVRRSQSVRKCRWPWSNGTRKYVRYSCSEKSHVPRNQSKETSLRSAPPCHQRARSVLDQSCTHASVDKMDCRGVPALSSGLRGNVHHVLP